MAKNENHHKAKEAKKDEFYTQYEDIQNEKIILNIIFKVRQFYVTATTLLKAISANSF